MRRILFMVALVCAVALAASCGTDSDGSLRLTYDGETCVYEGPTELKAGPVELTFVNESSDPAAAMSLARVMGDQTAQDLIDHIGGDGTASEKPAWVLEVVTEIASPNGGVYVWEGDLEASNYGLGCFGSNPSVGVWYGSWLTVEE
jgi:hypothetical protein